MALIKLKGNPIHTSGELPARGAAAADFKLVKTDLSDVSLKDFAGRKKILNIVPSLTRASAPPRPRSSTKPSPPSAAWPC